MSTALVSAVLLSTVLMNVEADSLPYVDPPSPWWPSYSYAFRGGNSILREQGEKLLLRENNQETFRTYAVIALVNSDYERVRDALQQLVKERWGILEEQDSSTGVIRDNSTRDIRKDRSTVNIVNKNLHWPILGEGLARLVGQLPLKTVREYQLTSQPYNKIESLNGFSQLVIRVSDGSALFDQPATILQLTRTDRSREWARTHDFHGIIPLPYKEDWWSVGIVTSTEIALIETVKQHIPGVPIRYFLEPGGFIDYDYGRAERQKRMEALRGQMAEAVSQLKSR